MLRVSLQFKRIEVLIEPSRVALMVRSSTQSLTKAALSAGLGTTVPLVHCILCDGELPPPPPPPPRLHLGAAGQLRAAVLSHQVWALS